MPAQRRRAHGGRHPSGRRRRRQPGPGHPGLHRATGRGRAGRADVRAAPGEPRLRRQHERRVRRHRAGRRGDRQLRHGRARGVAGAAARGGLQRRARGDRQHAHEPRHDPHDPRSRPALAPPTAGPVDHRDRRADRARLAAAAPAHPDRRRTLPLHPPLGARARRRLRSGVLARLRRGGGLLPALHGARAAPRGRRRPVRLPPRGGLVRQHPQRAPDRQRGRAQPPLPVLREGGARGRDVGGDPARALAGRRPARRRRAVGDDRRLLPRPEPDRDPGARARARRGARAAARRAPARDRPALARRPRARRARRPRGRADVARRGRRGHRADRHRAPPLPGDHAARPVAARPSRPPGRAHAARLDRLPQPRLLLRLRRVARLPRADARGARVRRPRGVLLAACARRLARRGPRRRRARRDRRARRRPPDRGRGLRADRARGRRGAAVPALPRHGLPAQEPSVRVRAVRAPARRPRLRRPARARRPARRARNLPAGGGGVARCASGARRRT